ncbi:E3 ubiquitin-protein ligase SINA-like 5 [Panicum miliaceum]|uniref:E3 ubiquitin-protein ligase SINA-like 5 n=1 Tax=Panicum miliaceum TaxID=4540 RepID=A0A3L6QBD5_PANMI|nr:E3 ubiquitin-protein ligase SINA-like 5 [Panicum miliaceum]
MGRALFTYQACLDPLKPPTFKCEAGHVVCGSCRVSHGQACGCAATTIACPDVDAFVREAKVPCPHYH